MKSSSKVAAAGKLVSRRRFAAGLGSVVTITAASTRPTAMSSNPPARAMKIRFYLDGTVHTARLKDCAASRYFVALLPLTLTLTLTLKDYASAEKVGGLPKRLSTQGAPASIKPVTGDIAYFTPCGNPALFYRDGEQLTGLVKLGNFHSEIDALSRPSPMQALIKFVQ